MKKVLHIMNGLGTGGAESFLINAINATCDEDICHDVMIRSKINTKKSIVESFGGKVYKSPDFPKHPIKNFIFLIDFFRKNRYDVVHIHMNALIYMSPLFILKNLNQTKIILHSHNSFSNSFFVRIVHKFNKKRLHLYDFLAVACSKSAGEWMFENEFSIIMNSIDINSFLFNYENRENIRKKYKIYDNIILLGNIGRLEKQKNQIFLLILMKKLTKISDKYKLILIGDGSLNSYLKEYVKKNKLMDSVIFTGNVDNTFSYYSAMDVFLMPSLYEGYPVSLIESQVSGLPAIISPNIDVDSLNSGNIGKIPSKHTDENFIRWIQNIEYIKNSDFSRNVNTDNLDCFSLSNLKKSLMEIYE